MNSKDTWPATLRFVWLTGGIVAVNEPNNDLVTIKTSVNGRALGTFKISSYGALFSAIGALGPKVLGATFITGADQLEGLRAPEFRIAGLKGGWPLWDTSQSWRQVVFASTKSNEMRLMDVASRIATGLQFSEMRLHDLAMSYSAQLNAHLKDAEPKEAERFNDTFSPGVYKGIHALFWEMAVLRDVLAEFVAVFCLSRDGVTTLSGLRRSLNKELSNDEEWSARRILYQEE